jgi:hypothetical protein
MKLAAFGLALTAIIVLADFANAFERRNALLGAPLYAGPKTVIIQNGRTAFPGYSAPITRPSSGWQNRIIIGNAAHYGRDRYDRFGNRRLFIPGYGYVIPRERHQPYGGRYSNAPRYYDNDRYGRDRYGRDRHDRFPSLTILGASYRSINGRACDAFSNVHRKCDGERSCNVRASNKICGDPERGRLKVLEISYACDGRTFSARVPEKSNARLVCR